MSLVTNIDHIFKKGVIGNVRKAQEDSHDMALKTPNGDVFVVCDGMGGHVGGTKASSLAVESIINNLKEKKYDNPVDALNDSLQFANMQILGFANEHPEYKGMGTTACVLLLQSDGTYFAHAGDSRIYLYLGKEKELHRITKDHSYVQTLVDAGRITDEQAEHHPNKNRILKALGVTPNLEPTFNKAKPKNGDIFLICSDGLCGMIPDSTIEKVLGQNSTLEAKGELLIRLSMQGETVQPGGQDNCTLELIEIDNSPWSKSEFESFNPSKTGKKKNPKPFPKMVKIIAVVAALIVALGVTGMYVIHNQKNKAVITKELKDIGERLDELNKDISNKTEEKHGIEVKKTDAENDLNDPKKSDRAKEEAKKRVENLHGEIDNLNVEISDLSSERDLLFNRKIELENKLNKTHSNESNNNRKK